MIGMMKVLELLTKIQKIFLFGKTLNIIVKGNHWKYNRFDIDLCSIPFKLIQLDPDGIL